MEGISEEVDKGTIQIDQIPKKKKHNRKVGGKLEKEIYREK